MPPWRHFVHVRTHVPHLRSGAQRNSVNSIVFNDVVLLKFQFGRVLQCVKRRHIDVFIPKVVIQVAHGVIRVLTRAIHGIRRLLLVNHFDDAVHKLQDGAVPAGKKIAAVNVEPRINDALVEAVVFAAPRPEIGVSARAFKIARLN